MAGVYSDDVKETSILVSDWWQIWHSISSEVYPLRSLGQTDQCDGKLSVGTADRVVQAGYQRLTSTLHLTVSQVNFYS